MSTSQQVQDDVADRAKRSRRLRNASKEIEKFIQPEWDTLKDMQENMKDSNDALKYLTHQLYFEGTMEVNLENLSYALMLFSVTADLRLVQEGARAVAILLRELNHTSQNKQVEEVINDTLTPMTADLNEIKQDLKAIQEQMKGATTPIGQTTYAAIARKERDTRQTTSAEIKRRQILIDQEQGAIVNTIQMLTEIQLVAKANQAVEIAKIGQVGQDLKIISARKLRNGGLLLETNTIEAADTIRNKKEEFCMAFGPAVKIKDRTYAVRIPFVPITHEATSEWERRRIEENSEVEKGHLTATTWVKPPQKRREGQRVATLIARFSTPQAANKAIKEGIIIQGRRVDGHKVINGPMRCYHCQRYGHTATNCPNSKERAKCPTCAGTHGRDDCTAKENEGYKCASCNQPGHTAWDPDCPIYRREMEKLIRNNSETQYRYYRMEEKWTWEIDPVYMVSEEVPTANRHKRQEPNTREEAHEEEDADEMEDIEAEQTGQTADSERMRRKQSFTQATLDHFGYARSNAREEGEYEKE